MAIKKNFSVAILAFVGLFNLLSFQNCGHNFEAVKSTATQPTSSQLTSPSIVLTKGPTNANTSSVNFQFQVTSDPGVTINQIICHVLSSGTDLVSGDCKSGSYSASSLNEGNYSFQIQVTTTAGVQSSFSQNFTIDMTAPTVNLNSLPAMVSANQTPSIGFSSTDNLSGVAKVTCMIDAIAISNCLSPYIPSPLGAGPHTFKAQATDMAGNLSSWSTYSWTIDLTVPTVNFASTPAAFTNSTSAQFSLSGTDVSSYTCKLDQASSYSSCTTSPSFTVAAGKHSLSVIGTSLAGLASSPTTYQWDVDTVAPAAPTLTPDVGNLTNKTSVHFSLASSDNDSGVASFLCSIDSNSPGNFTSCSSPAGYTLTDGSHSFYSKAVDKAGNISAASSVTWIIDTTPPSTPNLVASLSSPTKSNLITISYSSTDAGSGIASYTCFLDSVIQTTCSGSSSLTGLADGSHKFEVAAFDKAGNQSSSLGSFQWLIDSTVPTVTLTSMVPSNFAANTTSDTETFQWTASDNTGGSGLATVSCQFDQNSASNCSTSFTTPQLNVGPHTFTVTAVDLVGNSASASFNWTYALPMNLPEYNLPSYLSYININKRWPSHPQIFSDDTGNLYANSACGVFKSTDAGNTFSSFNIPVPNSINGLAFGIGRIYVATDGFWVSSDGGTTYRNTLNAKIAQSIFANNPPNTCSQVSFGIGLGVQQLAAQGNFLVLGTGYGLFVSHDGGESFTVPTSISGGYVLPPIQASSIDIVGNKIYVSTNWGDPTNVNTRPLSGGTCQSNSIPYYSVLVSTDGGVTFNSISSGIAAEPVYQSRNTPSTIYALGSVGTKTTTSYIRSVDSGISWSLPTNSPIPVINNMDLWDFNEILETSQSLFILADANYGTGLGYSLFRSSDWGSSFGSKINLGQADSEIAGFGLAHVGNKLQVMTNQGVLISSDEGNSFSSLKKFSSNFCTYPWWGNIYDATASGNNVYNYTLQQMRWNSTDGGKTFNQSNPTGISESIYEMYASGNSLYELGSHTGNLYVSTDKGATFNGPVGSVADANTGFTIFPGSKGGSSSGFYWSSDGSDQRSQVAPYMTAHNSFISEAISFGNRIVAGTYAAGLVVYENGNQIYLNTDIQQNGSGQWLRIRYVNGALYVLGNYMLVSYDMGKSFQKIPTAPSFPQEVMNINGVTVALSWNYMWLSTDKGQTFSPWTGSIK